MKSSNFIQQTSDSIELKGQKYTDEHPAKAVVVIVHGMAEHALRYERFAEQLVKSNYAVYAYDQRGHGQTAGSPDKQGFFAAKDGWQKVTDDLALIVDFAKRENSALPCFIFAHSMGTFVTRTYMAQNPGKVQGVILSGTAGSAGLLGKVGILLTKVIGLYKAKTAPSKLMDSMSFGDFNKAFKPNRTAFDWLSRDEAEVDKYVADPYCGEIFSIKFYQDMLIGLEGVNTAKHAAQIPKDFPIYLFAGEKDPVNNNGKQIKAVYDMYKNAGADVSMKLFPEARHEILNETNRDEITKEIISALDSMCSKHSETK